MSPKRPAPAPATDDGLALVPSSKRLNADAAAAQQQDDGIVVLGGGVAATTPTGKRQLRPSMLVLFFVAQVKEELRYNRRLRRVIRQENAISQQRTLEVFQKSLDNACQNLLNHINCSLQSFTERTDILHHELERLKRSNSNQRYRSEVNQEHAEVNQEQAAKGQGVELRFLNKLNDHLVYTKDKITAEDGTDIRIAIFRDNQIVTSGQLSSARIEILVLNDEFYNAASDNWTECEFNGHIVSSSKGALLGGVLQVKLKNGQAALSDVSFNMPSSKTGSGKLILAARVHSSDKAGLRIKEAVMNPVEVQVNRNKQNKKSDRPKLKDEVHRVKGISVKGCRAKWLNDNQINTVEDFLKALNNSRKEEKIRTECFKLKKDDKQWKATVEHARDCDLEGNWKLKSYRAEKQQVVLFFNCVHDLVGAKFCDCYVIRDDFTSHQKDVVNSLKEQAYDVLDEIPFDPEIEDDYPVSSAMNISIGDDASILFTDTAGPNPPDFNVPYQGQSLQEQIPPEQYGLYGYQDEGNQAGGVTHMDLECPQFGIAAFGCITEASQAPLVISEGTFYGGNNMIGPANVTQNAIGESFVDHDDNSETLNLVNSYLSTDVQLPFRNTNFQ